MKTPLVMALVAGAGAGAGSAGLIVALIPGEADVTLPAVDPAGDVDVAEELAALRWENSLLRERLDDLARRVSMPAPARVPANAPSSAEVEEIRDLLASLQSADQVPPQALQSAVEAVLDLRQERERAERDARRQEERDRRVDEQVARIGEKIGLDPSQQKALRDVLVNQTLQREEFFRSFRDGGNPVGRDSIRESFRAMTEDANAEIQGFMTPQQYEQYQELGEQGQRGSFFRGGDRGDRGGRRDG